MAIADYLRKLIELKNQLVSNLQSMGVAADENEKLNTLVPKVLQCETKQNVEFVEGTDFTSLQGHVKKVTIPAGVTSIGYRAFKNCSSLASITIPDSVTSIGEEAFEYCVSLANINIPAGVTSIGSYTFHSCESLASITIPDSVTSIRGYAFEYCPSLAHIYYTGTEEQWNNITIGSGNTYLTNATIHYNYVPE